LVFSVFSVVAASVAVPGSALIYALQRLSTDYATWRVV
jgi:hypothetical protein